GDASAHPFKTNAGNDENADPEINDDANNHPLQPPADNSLLPAAQHDDNGSPAATDGAHPGRGQVDGSESASTKFADDGSAHPGNATDKHTSVQSTPADSDHPASADRKSAE